MRFLDPVALMHLNRIISNAIRSDSFPYAVKNDSMSVVTKGKDALALSKRFVFSDFILFV